MDTDVHVQVISDAPREAIDPAVQRALAWFDTVERICTRFDRNSEVMQLLDRVGTPVRVSTLLFQDVDFALQLAEQTEGAFAPTIGASLEQRGLDVTYGTRDPISS